MNHGGMPSTNRMTRCWRSRTCQNIWVPIRATTESIAGSAGNYLGGSLFAENFLHMDSASAKLTGVMTVLTVAAPKAAARLGDGPAKPPRTLTGHPCSKGIKIALSGAGAANNVFFAIESFAKFIFGKSSLCLNYGTAGPWVLVIGVALMAAYGIKANYQMGVTGFEECQDIWRNEAEKGPWRKRWCTHIAGYGGLGVIVLYSGPGRVSSPARFLNRLGCPSAISYILGTITYLSPTAFTLGRSVRTCTRRPRFAEAFLRETHDRVVRTHRQNRGLSCGMIVVYGSSLVLTLLTLTSVLGLSGVSGVPNTGVMNTFVGDLTDTYNTSSAVGGFCEGSGYSTPDLHYSALGALLGMLLRAFSTIDALFAPVLIFAIRAIANCLLDDPERLLEQSEETLEPENA